MSTTLTQELFNEYFGPQIAAGKTLLLYSVTTYDLNLPTKMSSQSKVFDSVNGVLSDLEAELQGYSFLEATPIVSIFTRSI